MTIIFKLLKQRSGRGMDPLHVSMTGVKMGERFLMIGGDDRALIAGLASKVGLSGVAALASFGDDQAERARRVGVKIGALIDVRPIEGATLPFEDHLFDMIVIDDTRGRFASIASVARLSLLRDARRTVRPGGRVEVVEGLGGGLFGSVARPAEYDATRELTTVGFRPVRKLAERDGFRFLEGLNSSQEGESTPPLGLGLTH